MLTTISSFLTFTSSPANFPSTYLIPFLITTLFSANFPSTYLIPFLITTSIVITISLDAHNHLKRSFFIIFMHLEF